MRIKKLDLDEFIIVCPLGLISGIISYFALNEHIKIIIIFLALALLLIFSFKEKIEAKTTYAILLFLAFAFLGIYSSNARWRAVNHYDCKIRRFHKKIYGTIFDQIKIRDKTRLVIKAKIDDRETLIRLSTLNKNLNEAKIGDYIEVENVFINPIPRTDSNIARDLYFSQISGVGFFTKKLKIIKKVEKININARLFDIKNYFSKKFEQNLSKKSASIISTMLLGKKSIHEVPQETNDLIRSAGLSHLLAISGIHFYVIQSKIINLIKVLLIVVFLTTKREFFHHYANKINSIITIILGFFYLQIIGCPISAQRAFIMLSLSLIACVINRAQSSKFTLKLSSIIILMNSPESVFSPSFQMSFLSVAAILYNSNKNHSNFESSFKIIDAIKSNIKQSILISIAIAPCSCYYFGSFSVSGIFANVLAIPLVSLIILPMGLISLFVFIFKVPEIKIFFFFFDLSIKAFLFIAEKCSRLDLEFFLKIGDKLMILLTIVALLLIISRKVSSKVFFSLLIILTLFLQRQLNFQNLSPDIYLSISGDWRIQMMAKANDGNLYDFSGRRKNFIKDSWLRNYGQTKYISSKENNLCKKDVINLNIRQCEFNIEIERFDNSKKIKNIILDKFIKIRPKEIFSNGTYKIFLINCKKIKIEKENNSKKLIWMRCHNWELNPNLVLTKDAL